MPRRVLQAAFYRRHRDAVAYILLWLAIGFILWGQYDTQRSNHDQSLRADARIARIALENRRIAEDGLANAYASCRQSQEQAIRLASVVHAFVPRHLEGRTGREQANVDRAYDELDALHVFDVPKCIKPPKEQP